MSVLWIGRQGIKRPKQGNNPRNFTGKHPKTPARPGGSRKELHFLTKKIIIVIILYKRQRHDGSRCLKLGGVCMEKMDQIKQLDRELEQPADFTSPEVLYQDLIDSIHRYHPSDDISMVEKAYRLAYDAHKEQKRKSGEPYIIHPLCVAIILADLELDKETIVAGILHDVVEDTVMTTAGVANSLETR